ncbi:dynein light chain type 1-domain-containing protein [Amylostereum chailletii]|nr:dynein light chain type 1-domain-containing protein [Amylostereum chailletii]
MSEKLDAPTSSSTDTSGIGAANGPKATIKNVDMTEEMQQESVDIASAALEKYNIEKDIAAQIKKEFDRRHGPTWHVVVGKNFGSYVTHGERSIHPSTRVPSPCALQSMPLGHVELVGRALLQRRADAFFSPRRNQTFHLLLRRIARHPHLEIIIASLSTAKDRARRRGEGRLWRNGGARGGTDVRKRVATPLSLSLHLIRYPPHRLSPPTPFAARTNTLCPYTCFLAHSFSVQ